jgi:hypothetical protein
VLRSGRLIVGSLAFALLAALPWSEPAASFSNARADGRWFGPRSPLNTPIPEGASIDPRSAEMVAGIVHADQARGWAIAVKRWTVPVYYANSKTRRVTVRLTAEWRSRNSMLGVPIPEGAQPDPGSSIGTDGHMAVIDKRTGCFYEFYEASKRPDGTWEAKWANRGLLTGTGIQPGGRSTRASGFVNFAGLIRPAELQAGVIPHALTFAYPFTKDGGPVRPATDSDGRASTQDGWGGLARPANALPIPEGARVQLDPALDLNALDLKPWQKTVARALQVYGMFLADTSGNISLAALGAQSWRLNPYARWWEDEPYAYLPSSLAPHLRVLRLPPQAERRTFVAPSRCAVMR